MKNTLAKLGLLSSLLIWGSGTSTNYDDVKKLATTSTGIDVTGTVTADGLTVDDGEILLDSSAQAFLKIDRGSTSHFGLTRYYRCWDRSSGAQVLLMVGIQITILVRPQRINTFL